MHKIKKSSKGNAFFTIFKVFILVQFVILVMELILPAKSAYNNFSYRFLVNIGFYNLVFLIALFIRDFTKAKSKAFYPTKRVIPLSLKKLQLLLNLSTFLGFLGVTMILVDRVFLKKIDYSLGLRHARYQWINASSPSLFSDLLSKMGNVLVPMVFISVLLVFLYWEVLNNRFRLNRLVISITCVFIFAAMNGSRSIIFIQMFSLLSVATIRLYKGQSMIPSRHRRKIDKKFYVIITIAIAYALLVFNSSSKLGNINSKTLFEILVHDLGGDFKNDYYLLINDLIYPNSIIYHVFSAITYLIHSQWTSEALFSIVKKSGNIFAFSLLHFLHQIGIIGVAPEGYYFSGLFISLPGSIMYDFGIIGLMFLAPIYGVLLGIAAVKIERPGNSGGFDFAFIIFVLSTMFVAPFTASHNFIYFNFIIIDMILLELLSRLFIGKSTWIYAEITNPERISYCSSE